MVRGSSSLQWGKMVRDKKNNRRKPKNQLAERHITKGIDIKVYEYFDEEKYWVPENITAVAPEDLREMHSYWSNNYIFCLGNKSDVETNLVVAKRFRKGKFTEKYLKYRVKRRQPEAIARAQAELSKKVVKYDDEIMALTVQISVWESLTNSCETFMRLCSRDQSYREKELENYGGRGGQGK